MTLCKDDKRRWPVTRDSAQIADRLARKDRFIFLFDSSYRVAVKRCYINRGRGSVKEAGQFVVFCCRFASRRRIAATGRGEKPNVRRCGGQNTLFNRCP